MVNFKKKQVIKFEKKIFVLLIQNRNCMPSLFYLAPCYVQTPIIGTERIHTVTLKSMLQADLVSKIQKLLREK